MFTCYVALSKCETHRHMQYTYTLACMLYLHHFICAIIFARYVTHMMQILSTECASHITPKCIHANTRFCSVKFGEPSVIRQICQGFLHQKFALYGISYVLCIHVNYRNYART